jgi:putative ABC transport system permease protein
MKMMRWLSTFRLRMRTLFGKRRAEWELDEELQFHLEQQVEVLMERGLSPVDARRVAMRSLGGVERQMEKCRDVRAWQWLEILRADIRFGWRQLTKRKVTTAAAVLSLALGIGSCVAAFRLIDALLLRPLPIKHAERLYELARTRPDLNGGQVRWDGWAYPDLALMRDGAKDEAALIVASYTQHVDLTYASDEEMEKGYVQYVSGDMFDEFGLQPALGRLLSRTDDLTPGAHPYAVISYDYWVRRFGGDPKAVGKTFRLGEQVFEVVGVGPKSFTGTEPGIVTEMFLPAMMNRSVTRDDASWFRILAMVEPGVEMEPLRAKLDAISLHFETERAKGFKGLSPSQMANSLKQRVLIEPASSGVSSLQDDYRRALTWMGVLVGLVLLIACANVANLMTAQAATRAREMALRVSIGAGRLRLLQLVMVENVMLALLAAVLGGLFAWWSAPMVVRMINPADHPARLVLSADWRVMGFGLLLTLVVTMLFGLAPALRASAIQPVSALKGGEEPQAKRRSMYVLTAAQVAFCFLVLFFAGLFFATFRSLSRQSHGFDANGLLLLDTVVPHGRPPAMWTQVGETLHAMPGVKEVGISSWALLSANNWNGPVSVNGGPPSDEWGYFLNITPGWFGVMKMPLLEGRDFQSTDAFPGQAIVNQTFVKTFFHGEDPIGKMIEKTGGDEQKLLCQVVGVVADAPYRSTRDPILPVVFVPFRRVDVKGVAGKVDGATFVLWTSESDPMVMADAMRRRVAQMNLGFRVSNVQTQQELIDDQTVRERLLALLGGFFAAVSVLLAAIGLYGVLHYSVTQREREIGIRIALGAAATNIARLVTVRVMFMVAAGAMVGVVAGMASVRYVAALLYGVKATDPSMLIVPAAVLLAAVCLASVPAVMRAVRIDPAEMLRAE